MSTTAVPSLAATTIPGPALQIGGDAAAILRGERLDSVDLIRGFVMVVMALDHVRDYFHTDAFLYDPTDLTQTSVALFFTRWITHFCAPTFVFLAGTGAFLFGARGRTRRDLQIFLLTRGAWLVFLELTVIRFAWVFNFQPGGAYAAVIWALGWSMIVLAALIYMRPAAVAGVGVLLIASHNLLDGISAASFGAFAPLWMILHEQGPAPLPGIQLFIVYPVLPWIGVMAAGYGLGAMLLRDPAGRATRLVQLGLVLSALFVVLRLTNVYGDLHPWAAQSRDGFTALSVLNTTKYPPSLLYLLMTLGPMLVALGLLDRKLAGGPAPTLLRPLVVFGRVPMFYYVLHLYLIHAAAVAVGYVHYGQILPGLFENPPFPSLPVGYGYSLAVTYLVWALVVMALYPLCVWFAGVKRRRKDWWLSYM